MISHKKALHFFNKLKAKWAKKDKPKQFTDRPICQGKCDERPCPCGYNKKISK